MGRVSYTINTVDGVIEALGGVPGVIKLTARTPQPRTPQAISNWRAQARIASDWFYLMTSELERGGHCADPALWGQQVPLEQAA
jgi:hypothetical protein